MLKIELDDIFINFQLTGENKIDIDKVVEYWIKRNCLISQWKEEYTLHLRNKIKSKISKEQAHILIGRLDLKCEYSKIFNNGITWK